MTATQPQSRQLLGINQQTYQALRASISLDLRRQLLIAVCDSVEMQERIAAQLERDVKQQIESERTANSSDQAASNRAVKSAMLTKPMDRLVFDADDGNLPQQIANWMRHTLFTIGDLPRLQVLGIEQMTRQPAITQNYFLRSLDKIEALLPQLNTSLLVWVPWPWLRTIQQSSSTFWNWRNGVFEFVSDPTPTPANREALDIDVSMFEPERESQGKRAAKSATPESAVSKSATLNGSGDRLPESKAAQNGQGLSDLRNSASEKTTTPSNSTPSNPIQSVDLSNFFDIQKTASTQGVDEADETKANETAENETVANETAVDGAAVVNQVDETLTPLSEGAVERETLYAEGEAEDEPSKPEPMPLEFWDDDDFPIFDSDLAFDSDVESEAEKLDEADNAARGSIVVPLQISFEETDTKTVVPLPLDTEEESNSSDSEKQSEKQEESNPLDSQLQTVDSRLQSDEASADRAQEDKSEEDRVEENGPQAEDAQGSNSQRTVGGVEEQAPVDIAPIDIVSELDKVIEAPSQVETDSSEKSAVVEAPVSRTNQSAPPEKVAVKQKRKRRRNLVALGGLRSVVSQGVNVSSRKDAATDEALSNTSEQTAAEDDPAALLDALSKEAVNKPKQSGVDKVTAHYASTEIPVLIKKSSEPSSEQSVQTAISRQSSIEEQSTLDGQNPLLSGGALQVVERSLAEPDVEAKSAQEQEATEERSQIETEEVSQLFLTEEALAEEALAEEALSKKSLSDELLSEELLSEQELSDRELAEDTQGQAAQYFTEGLAYRSRIEAGEKDLAVIEPAIAAYEKGLAYLRDSHPDRITGLNDLGTLYWLKAQRQSEKAQAIACMKKSIQLYREALGSSSNSTADDSTQLNIIGQLHSNMGAVFTMLATCEEPVSNLMQAAESYQQALPMVPLDQNPEEYATLYNSLGSVYWKLSHYESVELYLHQAIAAYTEALLGYKPEQQPLDYAAVQNNLGITYWSLAKHEEPETLLKRAITAYRDALNYRTSDVDPAACAISYNNLALAYWDLSKHTHSDLAQKSRYQKNAITAFEAALNINNLSGALSPMDSAAIYHCLGDVHAQMTETAPSTIDTADSLQKSLYSYVKSIENLSTDSPAYPPRFGAIIANLRLHYDKLGLEGQQSALNRIPSTLLPQVMMAL